MLKMGGFKVVSTDDREVKVAWLEGGVADASERNIVTVKQEDIKRTVKRHTMLKFFKYDKGVFSINKEEVLLLPSAKKIIHNDKGGIIKGDPDGRKKLWAEKQFGVAWWITDINSPGVQTGLEGEELLIDAIKSLNVPTDWDHKKDIYFMAFLGDYTEMYEKASYAMLLKQMLMSFNDTAMIIKAIRDNSIKLLKQDKSLDATDISALIAGQKELINLAGDTPKQINKLKELQAMVGREEKEMEVGRGDIAITSSMRPDEN